MTPPKLTYTQAVEEVERILEKFNDGQMNVDELGAQVKRAAELIRRCAARSCARSNRKYSEALKEE